jgi:antitoxin component of RelBE/YafQ-DinJ toxin-antitoxin module
MQKTILQVPLDKQLKSSAEKVASKQGFSSLQEIVRVFLTQLASSKVELVLQESMTLSPENENRYSKMISDFKSGRGVDSADSVDALISKLNAD